LEAQEEQEDKSAQQEEAIAAIQKMKGRVEVDAKRPGKPVIKVHLFGGKTAGIGLAPLTKLPEIEWIGLHLSDITEADLEHLKGLTKLRRLGLADIHLSNDGLQRLEGMTMLEILYLMENPITDAGLDHLRKLTRLKELGLGQTKITDAGLERLKNFKDLEILRLQQLKISTAGLEHLKGLTKLKTLDLSGCSQVRDFAQCGVLQPIGRFDAPEGDAIDVAGPFRVRQAERPVAAERDAAYFAASSRLPPVARPDAACGNEPVGD
jgi:hypothetical protein